MRNISYSVGAFDPPAELIEHARIALEGVEYDTMIGTGLSGALVVPLLARAFDKRFAIVRKPGDSRHSSSRFEGEIGKRWIFVDDFISTGDTFDRVQNTVESIEADYKRAYANTAPANRPNFRTFFVGSYLYSNTIFHASTQEKARVFREREKKNGAA